MNEFKFKVISAISIFNMKLFNLLIFGNEETIDLNTIKNATFDEKMMQS